MIKSMTVTPDAEQRYLANTGKTSVAVAVFLMATALSAMNIAKGSATYWVIGTITLVSVLTALALSIKSMEFSKYTGRLAFWTLKFNDEYVDHVSAFSLRATCHVMMIGGLLLAFFGDEHWFVGLIAPLSLAGILQILVSVAMLTHGLLILIKLREEDADE